MRLLCTNAERLELKQVEGGSTKSYAILSHTWGDDEVAFTDINQENPKYIDIMAKAGYLKLGYALTQARIDGYDYIWADMCCIDKSSSADLSEAVNSMFRYYERAAVCYVYLSDVEVEQDLKTSRWFTRGWTLQELLAPDVVLFFSSSWKLIGSKSSLQPVITAITGISKSVLLKQSPIKSESVAARMSWASLRETTRIEDMAYCLLGIFGINMPLLYGEEENAFLRLQEEITKVTDDHSLFCWIDPDAPNDETYGLLAESPRFFAESGHFVPCDDTESEEPYSMVNGRLKIEVRFSDQVGKQKGRNLSVRRAVLSCMDIRLPQHQASIWLRLSSASRNEYRRVYCSAVHSDTYPPVLTSIFVPQARQSYFKRANTLPSDYTIRIAPKGHFSGIMVELLSGIHRPRPDPREHGTWAYTRAYTHVFTPGAPEELVGKPFPGCMAVALHFNVRRIIPPKVELPVTLLFGMTKDLKFGYEVLRDRARQSLDRFQYSFSPQSRDHISFLCYEIFDTSVSLKIEFEVVHTPQVGTELANYDVRLGFTCDVVKIKRREDKGIFRKLLMSSDT